MRLDGAERRRSAISMTSLIDVIFLLLLFFMLSSTFTRFGEIELTAPGGGAGRAATPVYLRLDAGRILLNGRETALDDVSAALAEQAEAGANTVLLKLDDSTDSQRFIDLYAVLRAVPDLSVAVLR
ncbi:biopolymer transporter ExbD [Oricola sp.]|uniref:ExbD/TolR family protein n=1 Tax=Oricola sp. TaxID=1979950 RepID=UPI0025EB1983|nr:biopolymer transporter ExbD [Oricola sp.]MCI5076938.1 biopolymer transporter ExbD [Oricola sp.]